jgi:hypothetical protein
LIDSSELYLKRRAERMMECGDDVNIHWSYDRKWIEAKRCRDKLCPLCGWRQSLTRFHNLRTAVEAEAKENKDIRFAFVTVTVRNCTAAALRGTIDQMNAAWREMTRRGAWKKTYAGYYRALEITYNKDENTYHPHFHAIAEIRFGRKVSEQSIRAAWRTALNIDYEPICEAHEIKPNGRGDIVDALTEVSRYALAPSMLEDAPIEVLQTIATHTINVRMITAGGSMKKLKRIETDAPATPRRETAKTALYWNPAEGEYIVRHKKYEENNVEGLTNDR